MTPREKGRTCAGRGPTERAFFFFRVLFFSCPDGTRWRTMQACQSMYRRSKGVEQQQCCRRGS